MSLLSRNHCKSGAGPGARECARVQRGLPPEEVLELHQAHTRRPDSAYLAAT